jgi:hypothetical protein
LGFCSYKYSFLPCPNEDSIELDDRASGSFMVVR